MEKSNKKFMILIFILTLCVLGMSIGFAVSAYNEVLTINAGATIGRAKWDVHFDKNSYKVTDNNSISLTGGEFNSELTTFTISNVFLNKPGDVYEFSIDVVNVGSFDAYLNEIYIQPLSNVASNYLELSVSSDNKIFLQSEAIDSNDIYVLNSYTGKEKIVFTLKYKDIDISLMPVEDINVDLVVSLNYVQKVE